MEKKHTANRWVKALIILAVTLFILIIVLGVLATWANSFTRDRLQAASAQEETRTEYNNYTELLVSDDAKMKELYENWADSYNSAIEDNKLTQAEVSSMGVTINEYAFEYKLVRQHLTNFKEFVLINEEGIKTLGVDTFKVKIAIDDTIINLENNIERMKANTQVLIDANEQYRQQLDEYLKLLMLFA